MRTESRTEGRRQLGFFSSLLADREPERRRSWADLVYLVRSAFEHALEINPTLAEIVLRRWSALGEQPHFQLFERLALYGLAVPPHDNEAVALDYVLGSDAARLWQLPLWPEIAHLLRRRRWSEAAVIRLTSAIENGPSNAVVEEVGFDADRIRYEQSRRFAKLADSGASLKPSAQRAAEAYLNTETGTMDERLVGPVNVRWVPPAEAGELVNLHPDQIADRLIEMDDNWQAGQRLRDLGLKMPGKLAPTLESLSLRKGYGGDLWWMGLDACKDIDDLSLRLSTFEQILDLVFSQPLIVEAIGPAPFASFVQNNVQLTGEERRSTFLSLWDLVWEAAEEQGESNVIDPDSWVSAAINAPGGNLAEALLTLLWQAKPKVGAGLPNDIKARLDRIAKGKSLSHAYGRVLLAAHLHNLHAVDRTWAKKTLIPLMDWTSTEAVALWEGFLWPSQMTFELFDDVKLAFLELPQHARNLADDYVRSYVGLVVAGLLETSDIFQPNDVRKFFHHLPIEFRIQLVYQFETRLTGAENKAATLWRDKIEPLVRSHFRPLLRDEAEEAQRLSEAVASMILRTREAFPGALKTVTERGLLTPITDPTIILMDFEQHTDHSRALLHEAPGAVVTFLGMIIAEQPSPWALSSLNSMLDMLEKAPIPAESLQQFQRLREIGKQG